MFIKSAFAICVILCMINISIWTTMISATAPMDKKINTIELMEKTIKMLEENERQINLVKEIATNITSSINEVKLNYK